MTITLHWPQITLLVLWLLGIARAFNAHGKVDPKPENAWHTVTALAILATILYCGGFWS